MRQIAIMAACIAVMPLVSQRVCEGRPHSAREVIALDQVLVIAHRGNSRAYPENTLPALCSAVDIGAALVEFDVHTTRDDVMVVIHDEDLTRTTDAKDSFRRGTPFVREMELEDIRKFDAGRWFNSRFVNTRVPLLQEALDAVRREAIPVIDHKRGKVRPLIDQLQASGLIERVVVQSRNLKFLARCHALAETLVLAAVGTGKLSRRRLARIAKSGATIATWQHQELNKNVISEAHELGLEVWAFEIDNRRRAQQLIRWGVDGLISNVPTSMISLTTRTTKQRQPRVATDLPSLPEKCIATLPWTVDFTWRAAPAND